MAQFGRFFRGAVRRTRWCGKALIAGAKTAIDAVLNRDRALISFEHLGDGPHHVYLLFAMTRIGAVGCPARDAHRALAFLPYGILSETFGSIGEARQMAFS
jgi:hypothetical protein